MVDLDGKALRLGIGLYMALYVFHILLLPTLVGESAANGEYQGVLFAVNQALGLATCLAPGFLAAKKAGHHGFMHGGVVGMVSTVLTVLLAMGWAIISHGKFYGLETLPFWLVINGFLGAFAGLVATNLAEDKDSV